MTILARLEQWKAQGAISPEQHARLSGLSRGQPLSLFLELNVLLYAGVLAFVGGLGWTVAIWSQQLGDVVVLTVLSAVLGFCLWYCFSRAAAWSPAETPAPTPVFDYVLYLGSLVWCVELAYLESRLHVLVPVVPGPAQGEKKVARRERPRINTPTADFPARRAGRPGAHGPGHIVPFQSHAVSSGRRR